MKHSLLAALSAVMTRPAVLRASGSDQLREALARISKSLWLLSNPRTSILLFRLFTSPPMRPLFRIEPRLMFKFLSDYLATDLSRRERAAMLTHHYTFLLSRVALDFFAQLADRRIELWRRVAGEHVHRIWLFFPRTPYSEGDLALVFESTSHEIYTLSFTIGPGTVATLDARDAMYIARVQGKGNGLELIREATKICKDVSPAALLLNAAEGIAEALGLAYMVGISAGTQVTTSNGRQPDNLAKAYDEFWMAAGGSRLARNMYLLTVPTATKPILSVKRDHRSRTHRKRRFKKLVKEQVCAAFRATALSSAAAGPGAPRISSRDVVEKRPNAD